MKKKFHESVKRSLAKAITYRSFILISDGIVVYAITHRYDLTLGVIIVSNCLSTLIYILHERFWNEIHWGKIH